MTKRGRGLVTSCHPERSRGTLRRYGEVMQRDSSTSLGMTCWTIPIARRNLRRASRKRGCARGDTAQRERMDIFANVFARQFRRAQTKLQLPNRRRAVRSPGDVRCSLLKSGAMRRANGAVVECRDRVAPANCGL